MVQERGLRGIEVGLKALDAVEVRARSNPLDIGQPLVADLGKRGTEVELSQRDVGRAHRVRSQDQLGGRQNPGVRDAPDGALPFDLELSEGLQIVAKQLSPKRPPPPRRKAVADSAAEAELPPPLHQRLAPAHAHGPPYNPS